MSVAGFAPPGGYQAHAAAAFHLIPILLLNVPFPPKWGEEGVLDGHKFNDIASNPPAAADRKGSA
jgi:hypothetical protein